MPQEAREPEHYASERLRVALAADPRVSDLSLRVRIVGDDAFVDGQVPTHARREAVAEVAAQVLPGHRLHNEVEVIALTGAPEVEDLA